MPSNLLQTKLLVPQIRPAWVKRPHLVEQLNAGLERNLILVSAPAGYGKSTLLSEWAHQVSMPVAWLTLDKADNNPSRFWAYFASALQTVPSLRKLRIGEGLMDLESISPSPAPDEALTRLVDEIAQSPEAFILILDDLHLITDTSIHTGLVFLLEHLPMPAGRMRLVIASRMDPPWPLARMRARAQTTELRTRDLRFTNDEVTAFINQTMGLNLSASDISQLDQRTEGWVAGLQMAALSIQKRDDIPEFLEKFSGSHRYILDYLIEEVLSQQPPRVMEFLLKTSILDQLTAPLCDAVTGNQDSQDILIRLEQSNVFLLSLDDEQRWYRYHHLFSDLLRKRLSTSHAGEIKSLHARASEWYEANGSLREAILHALQADDMKLVARLVSGNVLILAEGEDLPELLERFHPEKLEDVCSRPWLCISIAWAKAYAGQLDEAEGIDRPDGSLSARKGTSMKNAVHLMGHGLTIRAYVQWLKGRFEKAVDIAREALTKIPADDLLERANILIILGLATQNTEKNDEAIRNIQGCIVIQFEIRKPLFVYLCFILPHLRAQGRRAAA